MRKWFRRMATFLISGMMLVLLCTPVLAGDGSCEAEHSWNAGEVTVAPGTVTHGIKTYTCICGETTTETIHIWNNGELKTAGVITYTCKVENCGETKIEVSTGTVTTRADLEAAVAEVAWAYYLKGKRIQYDSKAVDAVGKNHGGHYLVTENVSPEYGTEDTSIYSVCSDFAWKSYYDAWGRGIYNCTTSLDLRGIGLFAYADNQPDTTDDVKTSVIRWGHPTGYSAQIAAWDDDYDGFATNNGFADMTLATTAETQTFLQNWETNLRPGDIITDNQHTMLYVGNGKVLHCSGPKYNNSTGAVGAEPNGAIFLMYSTDYLQGGNRDFSGFNSFIIQRPSELFVPAGTDTDGNLGNDIVTIEIPAKTQSRLEYPGMEINRTVDITPFGTATEGETLTYSVIISNKSNNSNYRAWSGDGDGVTYENLVITETIPAGTEFVAESVVGGGIYDTETRTITWLVNIAPGGCASLSYEVKVTANVGSSIINDGGFVDSIPSNSIRNIVGGAKMGEIEQIALMSIADQETSVWPETTDLAFANDIYDKLGTELYLPAIQNILTGVFDWNQNLNPPLITRLRSNTKICNVFTLKEDLTSDAQTIRNMMVDGYWGGYRFFTGLNEDNTLKAFGTTINEFKMDYLEPGDILVYVDVDDSTGELVSAEVMIYAGNDTLLSKSSTGNATTYSSDAATQKLWDAFLKANDLFLVLRPSQVGNVSVHNWMQTNQNCVTTTYSCSGEHNCGEIIILPGGDENHVWSTWSADSGADTHTRTCTVCGVYTETESHTWGEVDNDGTQTCAACQAIRTPEPCEITFLVTEGATVTVKKADGTDFISADADNVFSLLQDTYVYTVSKEGYFPETGEFTVTQAATITVTLDEDALYNRFLQEMPGIGNYGLVLGRENVGTEAAPMWKVTFATTSGMQEYTIDYEYLGTEGTGPGETLLSPNEQRISIIGNTNVETGRTTVYEFARKISNVSSSAPSNLVSVKGSTAITMLTDTTIKITNTAYTLASDCIFLVCDETGTIRQEVGDEIKVGVWASVIREGTGSMNVIAVIANKTIAS